MSFKIVPLASYWKGVGNIHILWQPFQLLHRILTDVSSITKRRLFDADFSPETGKNRLRLGQGNMGNPPGLPRCSLLINPWPIRQVCYSIVMKEKPTLVLHFFRRFLLTVFLMRRRMSMCISQFTTTIPVNNTTDFRERFEATTYLWLLTSLYFQCQISCWRHFHDLPRPTMSTARPRSH